MTRSGSQGEVTVLRIQAGRLITPLETIEDGAVLVDGERIVAAGPANAVPSPEGAERLDAVNRIACPGFIDCHIHGGGGFGLDDGPDAIRAVAARLASQGTTSFLATLTGAASLNALLAQIAQIVTVQREGPPGALLAGIHLEGPFMSPRKPGANVVAHLRLPSIPDLHQMLAASEGLLRVVTVAPELDGALELIRELVQLGITASIGHTDADYEQTLRAIEAGASCATHTYNAMNGLGHRAPGAVGAILTDARVNAELIADGVHVSPAAMQVLIACKGADHVHLVTDNIRWAGLLDGAYGTGDRRVTITQGACRLRDGTIAGSVSPMNRNVGMVAGLPGCGARAAIQMATLSAAQAAGISARTGSLEPGKDADLLILDSDFHVEVALNRGRALGGEASQQRITRSACRSS